MIKNRLKKLLKESGKSRYRLAKDTDISEENLKRMESNKTNGIKYTSLEKICKALNCTPGDLLIIEKEEN